jgi:hypothetical protein
MTTCHPLLPHRSTPAMALKPMPKPDARARRFARNQQTAPPGRSTPNDDHDRNDDAQPGQGVAQGLGQATAISQPGQQSRLDVRDQF